MLEAAQQASFGGMLPVWDVLRGAQVSPPGGILPMDAPLQWEPEYFYLAKTLAVADAAGAIYAPSSEDELRLLIAKSSRLGAAAAREGHPVELLREVARVLVPDLQLDAATAVAMRDLKEHSTIGGGPFASSRSRVLALRPMNCVSRWKTNSSRRCAPSSD
jgi:hypothetical protein